MDENLKSDNFQIVDNFLPISTFSELQDLVFNRGYVSWFYSQFVANGNSNHPYFYFCHTFYSNFKVSSDLFYLIEPILEKINPKAILRARANLYTNVFHEAKNENHQDFNFPHKGIILYLNTNNGKTILNNKHEIDSVENRALMFDPSIQHCSTHPTNSKIRVNIIINYF